MATMLQLTETTKTPNAEVQAMIKEDPNIYVPTEEEIDAFCSQLFCPTSVMPHGVFVLAEAHSMKIKAVSQNAKRFWNTNATELLDVSLLDLFHDSSKIEDALQAEDLDLVNPVTLRVKKGGDGDSAPAMMNLVFNRCSSGIIVDMEKFDEFEVGFQFHQYIRRAMDHMQACDSLESMRQQACQDWHDLCGFDRVHVYQYLEDDHGVVINEVRREHTKVPSALGLHYQASDTPRRTRQMLTVTPVRHVSDSSATDKGIRMVKGLVFDREDIMSKSHLRPPHQNHKDYLKHQGIAASVTLSLVVKGRLWGVIQAYHMEGPKFCSFRVRKAGEYLAQALSVEISKNMDTAALRRHLRSLQLNATLTESMYKQSQDHAARLQSLATGDVSLMDVVPGVKGVAIRLGATKVSIGNVPSDSQLEKLSQRLQKLWKKKRAPLYTEYLQDWQRDLKSCADKCAGALCVPLLEDGMIAWFRPEVGVTTLWGSSLETNYAKQNEMYAHVKFGVYVDDGKEKSAPWLKWEVEAADGVGALVGGVLGSDDDGVVGLLKKIRSLGVQANKDDAEAATELVLLIDSIKAPIFSVDLTGNVVQWNASLAAATGQIANDVIGKPLSGLVAPGFREALTNIIKAVVVLPESFSEVFLEFPHASRDSLIRVVANAAARKNAQGVCDGVMFVCADATHTKLSSKRLSKVDKEISQMSGFNAAGK